MKSTTAKLSREFLRRERVSMEDGKGRRSFLLIDIGMDNIKCLQELLSLLDHLESLRGRSDK